MAAIAVKTTWQYAWLTRRVERFERTADAFAARTHPSALAVRPARALLADLHAFLDIRCHRWNDAALADAAAMVCYGLLEKLLSRALPSADQHALHNTLLKALPGLVSSRPAIELWKLSRAVRADADLLRLLSAEPPAVVVAEVRRNPELAAFRAALETFLEDWGFRCSAELMLTVPSFQENPEPVIDLLRAYAAMDGDSPLEILDRQCAERLTETSRVRDALRRRRLFHRIPLVHQWAVVSVVLGWTQKSIQLRERARLKQALLYSRLRRIAMALGDRLAGEDRLAEPDDIFMLTTGEIDALVEGAEMFPHHVLELIRLRRRAHAELSATTPPDSMSLEHGEYLPVRGPEVRDSDRDCGDSRRLQGISACGGRTTARATILADVSESHLLARGDVLVTRQTDPGWGPVFPLISGLVMERGGMLSHGAIIAREFGIPSVVGVKDATRRISPGGIVRIDGDRGVVHLVEGAA